MKFPAVWSTTCTRTLGAVDDDVGDFLDGGGDNRYQISVRMTELYYEQ